MASHRRREYSLEAYAKDNAPHQACHPKEQAAQWPNPTATRYSTVSEKASSTVMFMIIEPVVKAGAGRLLVGVLLVCLYQLRHSNVLAAYDRVNIYDTRCTSRRCPSRACGRDNFWSWMTSPLTREFAAGISLKSRAVSCCTCRPAPPTFPP
jgi:hypothetical protein